MNKVQLLKNEEPEICKKKIGAITIELYSTNFEIYPFFMNKSPVTCKSLSHKLKKLRGICHKKK